MSHQDSCGKDTDTTSPYVQGLCITSHISFLQLHTNISISVCLCCIVKTLTTRVWAPGPMWTFSKKDFSFLWLFWSLPTLQKAGQECVQRTSHRPFLHLPTVAGVPAMSQVLSTCFDLTLSIVLRLSPFCRWGQWSSKVNYFGWSHTALKGRVQDSNPVLAICHMTREISFLLASPFFTFTGRLQKNKKPNQGERCTKKW